MEAPHSLSTTPAAWRPEYRTMRGWLILFFLGITVFLPVQALGYFIRTWLGERTPTSYASPNREVAIVHSVAFLGIAAFGIYAGTSLLRLKPNAVRIAKLYLLARLLYATTYFLAFSTILHAKLWNPDNLQSGLLYVLGQDLIVVGIWSWYFAKSVRVAGTYPPSESTLFR